MLTQQMNGSLAVWDLATGQMLRSLGETYNTFNSNALARTISLAASTSRPGDDTGSELCPNLPRDLTVVDVTTGEIIWQVAEPGSFMKGVVFTQDGSRILTIDWRCANTIRVWDAATGEKLGEWAGHQAPIYGISASPDGRWIATGSADKNAIIWDAATGTIVPTLPHNAAVRGVAFRPDSTKLLTYPHSGNLVVIWDTTSGQNIQQS